MDKINRYLFRAKTKTGEWIQGSLIRSGENVFIVGDFEIEKYLKKQDVMQCKCVVHAIIPETIGQFTGLTDKNGVKVFEGDKIEYYKLVECHSNAVELFCVEPENNWNVHEVYFEKVFGFVFFDNVSYRVKNNKSIIHLSCIGNFKYFDRIKELEEWGQLGDSFESWMLNQEIDVNNILEFEKHIKVIGNIYDNKELLCQN